MRVEERVGKSRSAGACGVGAGMGDDSGIQVIDGSTSPARTGCYSYIPSVAP